MKPKRKFWLGLCLAVLVVGSVLPIMNLVLAKGDITFAQIHRLFSLEQIRRHTILVIYKLGFGWKSEAVIMGRNGWLFLSNNWQSADNFPAKNDAERSSIHSVNESVRELKLQEEWLTKQGVMSLFVIVPDKSSIYAKEIPDEIVIADAYGTNNFIDTTDKLNLKVLDLRPVLKSKLTPGKPLYFKTDTHWNQYGAYLGYRNTIRKINALYGARIRSVIKIKWQLHLQKSGNLARLLNIDTLLGAKYEQAVRGMYPGVKAPLCLQKLSADNLAPLGSCESISNRSIQVHRQPYALLNQQALNRMNVLWIRDSFGDNNSAFFQHTFSRLWEINYDQYVDLNKRKLIQKMHPDLVIFQLSERLIFTRLTKRSSKRG